MGSRPKVGFDSNQNLYAVYQSGGKLVVASASKTSSYSDWAIVAVVGGGIYGFGSEPLIDQNLLTSAGILSVYEAESGPGSSTPIGVPLHVLDFAVAVPMPNPVALSFIGSDVLVTVSSQTGYTYQLQTTAQLSPADWQNVGVAVAGNGGLIALPHANGAQGTQRFYRILRTP